QMAQHPDGSPDGPRTVIDHLIKQIVFAHIRKIDASLGEVSAGIVQHAVTAGAIGIVGEADRDGRIFADFDQVWSSGWHVCAIARAKLETMCALAEFFLPYDRISIVPGMKTVTRTLADNQIVVRLPHIDRFSSMDLQDEVMFLVAVEWRDRFG